MGNREKLDTMFSLFKLLEKDIFESFYRNFLAKILLSNRPPSEDSAIRNQRRMQTLIHKKLEGMLRDFSASAHKFDKSKKGIELTIRVLTGSQWPTGSLKPMFIPVELMNLYDQFSAYYQKNNYGKRLIWRPHMGA